jgi:hypothetical protein
MPLEVRDLPKSEVKARLKVFWEEVELVNEPPIGHWPADLHFPTNEPNYHRPVDPHYYQAQGQDVPPEPVKVRLSGRTVLSWFLFVVMVGELALLFWPGVL